LNESVFFLIVGTGTEYQRVEKWFQNNKPKKMLCCYQACPKQDYDVLLKACDVGLIFFA
jgi:hypothetical protein